MALIQSTAIPSGATDYELEQSLKFNTEGSVSRTPTSVGNRKTWTFSAWVKKSEDKTNTQYVFNRTWNGTNFALYIPATGNTIEWTDYSSGAYQYQLKTNAEYRDPSAWFHLMVVLDTTQGTASNRAKMYVNGSQITSLAIATYPSQQFEGQCNTTLQHNVGGQNGGNGLGGYLAEVNFVDGQALTPADFGETGDYGEWKPIEYSGTYGTNGFYLPFKQDYTVEGFSATTYTGNGSNNYIGGTGFSPDWVWIKDRGINDGATYNHVMYDSVRGVTKQIRSDSQNAENTESASLTAFNTDGFTLGSHVGQNTDAEAHIAWCWDMGSPSPKQITANGNAKISTTQEKFGSSSAYFDGTGDYLSIPQSSDFDLASTTNFTVECWVYHTDTIGGDRVYVSQTEGTYANSWYLRAVGGGEVNLTAWIGGSNFLSVQTGAGVVTQNNWHHVALVKTGTDYKIFIDGTDETYSGGTDSDTATFHSGELRIGDNGSGQYMTGYIDEIRISDTARYSSNFTPSASAFTRDSNTKLLMHNEGANNSTEFLDHSGMDVNTNGDITSNVKANPTYGQSIVSYTGTGANATVGHGLSSAPEMIITKNRDSAIDWVIYHTGTSANPQNEALSLNTTSGNSDYHWWNDTAPTNAVFSLGNANTNNSSAKFIAYCFHSVAGYSKFSNYSGSGSAGNKQTLGFAPAFILIKRTNGADNWYIFDNARSPSNPVDVAIRANTNDVEDDLSTNWSLTFLSDGFEFLGTGLNASSNEYIYMAFADTREYAYWLDQSGNNNDWTSNNLTESDISVDSPTNNFCTWNPLQYGWNYTPVYTEGNTKISFTNAGAYGHGYGTIGGLKSGKWYWETLVNAQGTDTRIGIAGQVTGSDGEADVWRQYIDNLNDGNGKNKNGGFDNSYGSSFTSGDIIGLAVDIDNGTIAFYNNNSSQGTAYTDILSAMPDDGWMPHSSGYNTSTITTNFGQDSSFAGAKTAQGNQDGNGIGDFYYTPPTGFNALCTKNLPDVDVVPSEHFNTVLYTGDATTSRTITGAGFAPDLLWGKIRSTTNNNFIFDTLRGANRLVTNSNGAESDYSTWFSTLTSDGFTTGTTNANSMNQNNATFVAWFWKANGSGSSNTNGSITSTVSANVDAGFSIVSYTVSGESDYTTGHGLSKAPELILWKSRDRTSSWSVYAEPIGNAKKLSLDTTAAEANTGGWSSTTPSNTLVYHGGYYDGDDIIYYAFHSVDGYSKCGSYTGNGSSTDGTFIYTGFKPAYFLCKNVSQAEGWEVWDSTREPHNLMTKKFSPNTTEEEWTSSTTHYAIDFLSNGVKLRTNYSAVNNNNQTFIFIAFAETPFKYSNAR